MTESADRAIRDARPADAGAIAELYNHYIQHTTVTFEETAIDSAEIERRLHAVQSAQLPWLVATREHNLVGYAYATPWRSRRGYRYSVEVTVYVAPTETGGGWGSQLYGMLFTRLSQRQLHSAIGGIALPNDASVALHEKFGMRKVAHFKEVGVKFGRWIDVGYWQRILNHPTP